MNSYFASVEQQANPHLRGRPMGVCEHLGGIIIAPSVEAKRLGIRLGTPVWEAVKICPKIVLLPTDPDKYRYVTQQWIKILQDYSDEVEQYSIDEAFIDITPSLNPSHQGREIKKIIPPPLVGEERWGGIWDNALILALEIKQRLRQEVGEWVSCSIGIGPNKLVSKIAADLDGGIFHPPLAPPILPVGDLPKGDKGGETKKQVPPPLMGEVRRGWSKIDRVCIIMPDQIDFLYDLMNLTDIPGIGKRLEIALNKLKIFTLRELRDYPVSNLLNQFGIWGYVLKELANFDLSLNPCLSGRQASPGLGRDTLSPGEERVGERSNPKSIGHMYTLPRPIKKTEEIKGLMLKLSEKVGRRMRRHKAKGNVIHYFHSSSPHPTLSPSQGERDRGRGGSFSRQRKLGDYLNDGRDICREIWKIFEETAQTEIKSMGISMSGLIYGDDRQILIERYKKPEWIVRAMDRVNDRYGEYTIVRGRMLRSPDEWARDTVGFGR